MRSLPFVALLLTSSTLFAAGREIGILRPELPARTSRSAVAANGSTFLAAWTVIGDKDITIHAGALAADGSRKSDVTIATAAGLVDSLRVFANGDVYAVVWSDSEGVGAARVSRDATPLQGTRVDSRRPAAFLAATDGRRIAIVQQPDIAGVRVLVFDPLTDNRQELRVPICGKPTDVAFVGNALVLTSVSGELCVRWIPLDGGAPVTSRLPGVSAAAAVIASGHDALLVWSPAGRSIRAATITGNGQVGDVVDIVAAGFDHISLLRPVPAGDAFLLAFGANTSPNQNSATLSYAMTIDATGRPLRAPTSAFIGYPASIDAAAAADRALMVVTTVPGASYTFSTSIDLGEDLRILDRNLIAMVPARANQLPQSSIAVASNGVDFLSSFVERHYPYYSLAIAAIGADGSPRGPMEVSPSLFAFSGGAALSFAGSAYLHAAVDNESILIRRFTPNGLPIDPQPVVIADEAYGAPVVTSDGRNFLVVWTGERSRSIAGATVTPNGEVGPIRTFAIAPPRKTVSNPRVASDGRRFVLTYNVHRESTGYHDYYTFLRTEAIAATADGATGPPIILPGSIGFNERIASNGRDFLVVNSAPEGVIGWPLTLDGTAIQPVTPRLYARVDNYAYPAVAWNGGEYAIAFRYATAGGETFLGVTRVRNGMPGEILTTPTGINTSLGPEAPAIAVNALGTELILVNERRDAAFGDSRAVAYLSAEISDRPERPRAPLITSARYEGGRLILKLSRASSNERGFYLYAQYGSTTGSPMLIPAGATQFEVPYPQNQYTITFTLYAWNEAGTSPPSNRFTVYPPRRAIGRR